MPAGPLRLLLGIAAAFVIVMAIVAIASRSVGAVELVIVVVAAVVLAALLLRTRSRIV
jgi:hypothetical protein